MSLHWLSWGSIQFRAFSWFALYYLPTLTKQTGHPLKLKAQTKPMYAVPTGLPLPLFLPAIAASTNAHKSSLLEDWTPRKLEGTKPIS